MPRDLKADQEMLRKVLELAERREIARAAAMASEALGSGFEHPLLLNVLATWLEHQGRLADSLRLLQRAQQLAPDDIAVQNALSLCLQRLDRPAEALQIMDSLLEAHPELGFAHANRGNALIALGALGEARQSHLRALELDPGNLAAQGALASIATHRGEHEEARSWARKVLARLPGYPDAVLSLAAAELASGATDSAQLLLVQLLGDQRVGPAEKARANGLLGDVLDATGQYGEAFRAYAACNEALRQLYHRHAEGTGILPYTESIIAAMQRVDPMRWRARARAGADTGAESVTATGGPGGHVFLLGFPRSGTTLLEVALDGHPRVSSLEEHELLEPGVMAYMREPVDFGLMLKAGEAELQALRAEYWRQARAAGARLDGKVFVDKHPLNTLKLPLIARLFPEAKILFAQRDPRDVVQSCFRRRFSMNPAMYQLLSLEGAASFYDATMRLAELSRRQLGLVWQSVRYESVVDDMEQQLRAICTFLGLEWHAALTDFAARSRARERATPSTAQLARGLNRAGIGHWRNYEAALAPILPTLAPWVQQLGYGATEAA
jgi:tetratricopeptide (TPR) repeat protein